MSTSPRVGSFQWFNQYFSDSHSVNYSYWIHLLYQNLTKKDCRIIATAKLLQSCPTLCNPIDGSPPGSPIPGILQARTLEWVATSFSNAWKWKVKRKSLSHVRLFATPWTAACQAPPSMGFARQEYWSGVPLPSPKYCYSEVQLNTVVMKRCFWKKNSLSQSVIIA